MVVLVGYASAYGSTEQIAQRITAGLKRSGLEVETRAVSDIDGFGRYEALVLGSAVHNRAWLAPAEDLVRAHATTLAARPVWLFSVGLPGAVARPLRRRLGVSEKKMVGGPLEALIHPRDHQLFTGVLRREHFPSWISRLVIRLMGCHYGDFRDWDLIDRWTDEIATQLAPAALRGQRHIDAIKP